MKYQEYQIKNINVCGKNIECYLIKKNIKNIYFKIENKELYISVPKKADMHIIDKAILSKEKWIYDKLNKENTSKKIRRQIHEKYYNGDYIYLLGKQYQIKYQAKCVQDDRKNIINSINVDNINKCVYIFEPYDDNKKRKDDKNDKNDILEKQSIIITNLIYRLYEDSAKDVIYSISDNIGKKLNLTPNKLSIKRLKRAWGYCSSKKHISINIDCIMYDEKVIESVILHEYCHLKYMNHKKDFWNMVFKYMPEYDEIKKRLE